MQPRLVPIILPVTFHGSSFVCFGEEDAEEKYKEFESAFVNRQIGKFINGNKKIIRSGNVTNPVFLYIVCNKTVISL